MAALESVTTLSNVQSIRTLDHQIVAALNQNAQALIEVQKLLIVLIESKSK